jgi:hypothetical protein
MMNWWTPFSYGGVGSDEQSQLELLNLLLPFLHPAEQGQAALYIYNQRAADEDLRGMVPEAYGNVGSGAAQSTDAWLANLGQLSQMMKYPDVEETMPWALDDRRPGGDTVRQLAGWQNSLASLEGGVDTEWFKGLGDVARQLQPNSTRAEQRDARTAFDAYLESAPSDMMRQMGSYLLDPYLSRPNYGQAALFGNYQQPFQIKGGLVANPWYV